MPIVVVLLLGFFSGWHKDFNGDQATVLKEKVADTPHLAVRCNNGRSRFETSVQGFLALENQAADRIL